VSVEGYLALALAAVALGIGGYTVTLLIRRKQLERRRAGLRDRPKS
jgi:CcmD family protein